MGPATKRPASSDRGVALLIVVIALAALSLLIGALVSRSRQYTRETIGAMEQAGA